MVQLGVAPLGRWQLHRAACTQCAAGQGSRGAASDAAEAEEVVPDASRPRVCALGVCASARAARHLPIQHVHAGLPTGAHPHATSACSLVTHTPHASMCGGPLVATTADVAPPRQISIAGLANAFVHAISLLVKGRVCTWRHTGGELWMVAKEVGCQLSS